MPRKKRVLSDTEPYFVTARSNNKEWFYLPQDQVWTIFCDLLYMFKHQYNVRLHAFVLMSNHFHLLMSTPEANISQFMCAFMSQASRTINHDAGRINHVFGARHDPCLIKTPSHFAQALKYLYRNPVRANMVKNVEDHPHSTLPGLFGQTHLMVPIQQPLLGYDCLIPEDPEQFFEWLNEPFANEDNQLIKKALSRPIYKIPADPKTRKMPSIDGRISSVLNP